MEDNSTEQDDLDLSAEPVEQDDGSAIIPEAPKDKPRSANFMANLASKLPNAELSQISLDLLELIEKDKEARKKRDKQQEEGLKRTGLGDDAPGGALFDGAATVVHPALAEGCVDFSARAMKELFPAKGPVKSKLFGKQDKKKLDKAKAKTDFLNWQLTDQIEEYRAEKEILLTQLPLGGSQYEKYWYDPALGRIRMEFVPIDEVYLPFAATSFYTSPRITHEQKLIRQTFEDRVRSGFYLDLEGITDPEDPEESASAQANEKIEGKESTGYNEDGVRVVFEVQCWRKLKGDKQPRPYIVHIDEPTTEIVAIYRNWREGDDKARKLDWWVEDKFIPWRGVYGIGLLHLIGSLVAGSTGALRALLDAALINNAPTAVKLKGGRASGQNSVIDITAVQEIEAPAGTDDIRKVIMPMPFNPPSAVLFQLLEWLTNQAKGVVATAEESIADASNTMPVGTALALIEQGSQVFSSIHARLHASQAKALSIICRLNYDYPNLEDLQRFELQPEDFADNDDVEPVSDPNIFSEAQRYAQLQETLKLKAAFPDLQWNSQQLVRRALQLMRVDYADEVLPPEDDPFTGDPVTENQNALMGRQLKAEPHQDHIAHLQEHIRCLMDPMLGAGPLFPGPLLQNILANCTQHIVYLYSATAMTAGTIMIAQNGQDGQHEKHVADAAAQAMNMFHQQFGGLAQQLQQCQQLVQSKMPQPPKDPAIEATLQAAMAETQRRAALDKQTGQIKQMELAQKDKFDQLDAQAAAMKAQADAALEDKAMQFQQALDAAKHQADQELNAMREQTQIQVAKIEQQTELIKDLQAQHATMATQLATPSVETASAPDFGPQLQQLNEALRMVEQSKTQDALGAVMQGLQAVIQQMGAPRMIIEDAQGKPIGIKSA